MALRAGAPFMQSTGRRSGNRPGASCLNRRCRHLQLGYAARVEDYLLRSGGRRAAGRRGREQTFFARCGLGQTMTAQVYWRGRMIVEIWTGGGVRPAEFIVLRCAFEMQSG